MCNAVQRNYLKSSLVKQCLCLCWHITHIAAEELSFSSRPTAAYVYVEDTSSLVRLTLTFWHTVLPELATGMMKVKASVATHSENCRYRKSSIKPPLCKSIFIISPSLPPLFLCLIPPPPSLLFWDKRARELVTSPSYSLLRKPTSCGPNGFSLTKTVCGTLIADSIMF